MATRGEKETRQARFRAAIAQAVRAGEHAISEHEDVCRGGRHDTVELQLVDLLVDAMHVADKNGVDFSTVVRYARSEHDRERSGAGYPEA